MSAYRTSVFGLVLFLTGCMVEDSVFEPSCQAFEGERIELRQGRFVWNRFTDQLVVDENDEVVDPFPEYPKTGTYDAQDDRLQFDADDDSDIGDRFLFKQGKSTFLLSAADRDVALAEGKVPTCALHMIDNPS